jgi:Skp family chaperone for outer membrane proteins
MLVASIAISCNTPAQKVENAQADVVDANKDLEKANAEYTADIESYRNATAEKIATNEKSIADFKARTDMEKKDAKAEYKKKIADLEKRNTDMKKKMDEYQEQGKENWETFKTEFNHDMDEIGNAFKDLTVTNVKK